MSEPIEGMRVLTPEAARDDLAAVLLAYDGDRYLLSAFDINIDSVQDMLNTDLSNYREVALAIVVLARAEGMTDKEIAVTSVGRSLMLAVQQAEALEVASDGLSGAVRAVATGAQAVDW